MGEEIVPKGSEPQGEAPLPEHPAALAPAAQRALAEAEERRRKIAMERAEQPRETGGREGPDPARYGDWENGGIASDF